MKDSSINSKSADTDAATGTINITMKKQEWANTSSSTTVLPGMKLITPGSKKKDKSSTTAVDGSSGCYVVSLVVEIVSCNNLAASDILKTKAPLAKADPYVKVKLASKQQQDIHKTKPILQNNNPHYTLESRSSFVLDGMPVQELEKSEGLLFKVKHAGDKTELGYLHVTPNTLLQASGQDQVMELMHPNTLLPGNAGSLTIRCRPAEASDIDFYKVWGYGYFKDYTPAASGSGTPNGKELKYQEPNNNNEGSSSSAGTDPAKDSDNNPTSPATPSKKKGKSWKKKMFGGGSKSKKKAKQSNGSASAMVVAAATATATSSTPEITTAPSTDDTVDTLGEETNGGTPTTTTTKDEDESAVPPQVANTGTETDESEQTKDATVMSGLTTADDGDVNDNNNNLKQLPADPYKAGEVEDLEEALAIGNNRAMMCPDDCFAGNCVIQ